MDAPPVQTPVLTPYEACLTAAPRHIGAREHDDRSARAPRLLQSCRHDKSPSATTTSWNETPQVTTVTTTTLEPVEGSSKLDHGDRGWMGGSSRKRTLVDAPRWIDLGIGAILVPREPSRRVREGGNVLRSGMVEYAGVLSPHIQYWARERCEIGAGIRPGFGVYSGKGLSGDPLVPDSICAPGPVIVSQARQFGVAVGRDLNLLSVRLLGSLTVLGFLIGYQTGPKTRRSYRRSAARRRSRQPPANYQPAARPSTSAAR